MTKTRVTPKYQTTVPREVRRQLGIRAGDDVEWQVVRQFAVVRPAVRVLNPVEFLRSQAQVRADAVKLVRRARLEM